ncbi:MAG TPA: cytochrome c, partial [Rhodocyclaceae bacterium]|nr:cytochrome c [Rhodocyclaceae bacterium]
MGESAMRRRFLACAGAIGIAAASAIHAAEPDLKRAAEIVANRCALCHGPEGDSVSPIFPRLAAQHPEYIAKQLADFQAGRRKGTMNDQAKDLSPDEMRALGVFFSQKKTRPQRVRDEDLGGRRLDRGRDDPGGGDAGPPRRALVHRDRVPGDVRVRAGRRQVV